MQTTGHQHRQQSQLTHNKMQKYGRQLQRHRRMRGKPILCPFQRPEYVPVRSARVPAWPAGRPCETSSTHPSPFC